MLFISFSIIFLCISGADPTKENSNGHLPSAYCKDSVMKKTLDDHAKKVQENNTDIMLLCIIYTRRM